MNSLDLAIPQANVPEAANSTWKDWLGIVASIGCAIHCAAMPFVIAYLPALGLSFLADEAFHKWMALACFLIAIIAFIPGILKHGNWVPISIGGVGLVLITYAAFGLAGECCASCRAGSTAVSEESAAACCDEDCQHCESTTSENGTVSDNGTGGSESPQGDTESSWLTLLAPWITPVGGVILVCAHLLNRRYGYNCSCCSSGDEKSLEMNKGTIADPVQ